MARALAGSLFPAIVVVALAAIALENREPEPEPPPESVERRIDPTFAGYGIRKISPASVGPFLSTPRAPVIAVVPARGGTPHGATPRDVVARSVDWRPDGRALLVAVTDGLVEVPVGGDGNALWRRHRRVAALRGESPAYTPDGSRITFLAVLADLVVADRAGRERRLTSGIGDEVEPAWSPDSRWIAFVASEIDSGH